MSRPYLFAITILFLMNTTIGLPLAAQPAKVFDSLPALPNAEGWAGMYAGVSNGVLFCMGGANFPGKKPWEGGSKKWYDGIYRLDESGSWVALGRRLPQPAAYGVSASYRETIILAGGCNATTFSSQVLAYRWSAGELQLSRYPDLPKPLANMAGTVVNHCLVLAGGTHSATADPVKECWLLNLDDTAAGWIAMPPIPGEARMYPACASVQNSFYLFSGQNTGTNAAKASFSQVLQDAFRLDIRPSGKTFVGTWKKLAPMPRAVAGIGNPLPVLGNGKMFFWGGIDAVTNLHKDPSTFPGISGQMLLYDPPTDSWEYAGAESTVPARVTLPVVRWNDKWAYINGEIRSGIRTNTIATVNNNSF